MSAPEKDCSSEAEAHEAIGVLMSEGGMFLILDAVELVESYHEGHATAVETLDALMAMVDAGPVHSAQRLSDG